MIPSVDPDGFDHPFRMLLQDLQMYLGLILKAFDSTSDPDIKMGRTPREEVIQQCYSDLAFAEANLPDIDDVKSDADWGRVSKSAARGMLVRIGLYEGTYSKYHNLGSDAKSHLKVSIDAAERLINSGIPTSRSCSTSTVKVARTRRTCS